MTKIGTLQDEMRALAELWRDRAVNQEDGTLEAFANAYMLCRAANELVALADGWGQEEAEG